MPAQNLALAIEQGASFALTLTLRAGTGADAPALDLSGASARMQLRTTLEDATVLIELSTANGRIQMTDAPGGRLRLALTPAETAALAARSAVYDLLLTSAGGQTTRLLRGAVTLSPGVTR